MPISGYFDVVFAESGDLITVPDGVQSDGSISYSQGWGSFYAQDPTIDPATALFIDRAQTNQLFYDVTLAIQYIQRRGAPPFITTSMNGGSAYSYIKGAISCYDAGSGEVNWISVVNANTSIPGADANWLELPSNVTSIYTGGTSTGSGNAQTVATTQGGFALTAGNIVTWKAGFSNSTTATLNVDGVGATAVKKVDATGLIGLTAYDIVVGAEYMAISDGTTLVLVNPTNGGVRQKLSGNTTFYVATTGNDTTGTGTAALPWLTIQHAYDYIASKIDIGGYACSIDVEDGTYAAGLNATTPTVGGIVTLIGNTGTPTNVVLSTGGSPCIAAYSGVQIACAGGFKVTGTSYQVMARGSGAVVTISGPMNYGAGGGNLLGQINAFWGGFVEVTSDYTISGGAGQHYYAAGNGVIRVSSITVTVSSTPAFAGQFALASSSGALQLYPNTYSGSATGTRYLATVNGTIDTNGGGASYLPGNAGGSATNGGQYV